MARMNLRVYSRNARRTKVRRASWPTGFYLILKKKRNGRIDRECLVVYPAGNLAETETRQRMIIDPEKLVADDWEEFQE
jgi:hypothetical protein